MSSIPNKKIKHAHVHHDAPTDKDGANAPKPAPTAADAPAASTPAPPAPPHHETLGERARELADEAVGAVKERPKTIAAIGAAVLAGAAALVGGPAIAKAIKGEPKPATKKAPTKKPVARKPAAKKAKG